MCRLELIACMSFSLHCKLKVLTAFCTFVGLYIAVNSGMLSYIPYISICVITVFTFDELSVMYQEMQFKITLLSEGTGAAILWAMMSGSVSVYLLMFF